VGYQGASPHFPVVHSLFSQEGHRSMGTNLPERDTIEMPRIHEDASLGEIDEIPYDLEFLNMRL
jgi:hypothetical protein